jgi:hypothetical protein
MTNKFIITEEEKLNILGLYNILNEQNPNSKTPTQAKPNSKTPTQAKPTSQPQYVPSGGYKVDPNYDSQAAMRQIGVATTYTHSIDTYSAEWCRNNKINSLNCIDVFCQRNPSQCKQGVEVAGLSLIESGPKKILKVSAQSIDLLTQGKFIEFFDTLRDFLMSWTGFAVNLVLDVFTESLSGVILWSLIFLNDIAMYFQTHPKFSWGRIILDLLTAVTAGISPVAKMAGNMEKMTLQQIAKHPQYKTILVSFYQRMKSFTPTLEGIYNSVKGLIQKFPAIKGFFKKAIANGNVMLAELERALGATVTKTAKVATKVGQEVIDNELSGYINQSVSTDISNRITGNAK